MARLQHLDASLAEGRKTCGRTSAITHFLYQMVTQQAARLTAHGTVARQSKAAHHILAGEFFGQSVEGKEGLLLTLHVHRCFVLFVVEILLC